MWHLWRLSSIRPVRGFATWHVTSHQASRRNALVASTALARDRQERIEADDFVERHLASATSARGGGRSA